MHLLNNRPYSLEKGELARPWGKGFWRSYLFITLVATHNTRMIFILLKFFINVQDHVVASLL